MKSLRVRAWTMEEARSTNFHISLQFESAILYDISKCLGKRIETLADWGRPWKFLGNMVLHLWDCGGQETFMENYMTAQRDQIFKNVQVLIYVFDVESREVDKDYRSYQSCLEALMQNSPTAKVFCLIHKMDLNQEEMREKPVRILRCYVSSMEQKLKKFAEIMDADEVLLFEKATFLVIAQAQRVNHDDVHRFEKVSNIIKQFKLSCSRMGSQFERIQIRNSTFVAFIDVQHNLDREKEALLLDALILQVQTTTERMYKQMLNTEENNKNKRYKCYTDGLFNFDSDAPSSDAMSYWGNCSNSNHSSSSPRVGAAFSRTNGPRKTSNSVVEAILNNTERNVES